MSVTVIALPLAEIILIAPYKNITRKFDVFPIFIATFVPKRETLTAMRRNKHSANSVSLSLSILS